MNQRNPEISKGIDWTIIWIFFILSMIGVMAIFGATYNEGDPVLRSFIGFKTDYSKQLYFFFAASLVGLFILLTDSKFFSATANLMYAVGIFSCCLFFHYIAISRGQSPSLSSAVRSTFNPLSFARSWWHLRWPNISQGRKPTLPNCDHS